MQNIQNIQTHLAENLTFPFITVVVYKTKTLLTEFFLCCGEKYKHNIFFSNEVKFEKGKKISYIVKQLVSARYLFYLPFFILSVS